MIKLEMFYDAKCKHCKFFDRYSKGKQVKHRCKLTNHSLTLKSRVCDKFEL
jgi:hypothetical protein